MAHILIGFAEALPAPEVVFSLVKAGHEVSAFARNTDLPLKRLPVSQWHTLSPPEKNTREAVSQLQAIMASTGSPDFLLPMDDVALWLANTALGKDNRIAGAVGKQAEIALNKAWQVEHAQVAGMAVPETQILENLDGLENFERFPYILKPALAVSENGNNLSKGGVQYLLSAADVNTARAALMGDPGPFLLQPLINGVGEGVFGFVSSTGITSWSGHRRLRMMNPHGSGSSACTPIAVDDELKKQISKFMARINWQGAFMVELLRDSNGVPWFMELNGRMWGSMALARRQGFEYPAWNVAYRQDSGFVPPLIPVFSKPFTQRNLGREILHLLFVLRGPKSDFHKQSWPRFLRSLLKVLTPVHPRNYYNYDPAFRSYFFWDALWTVRRALKR